MKIKDFIKEGRYYGYRIDGNVYYIRVDKIIQLFESPENTIVKISGKYIEQHREEFPQRIITESGISIFNFDQLSLDNEDIWEMSREAMIETAMNISNKNLEFVIY